MNDKPAARLNDTHQCPKEGHDNGNVATGSPNVTFNGQAAARVGDDIICADGSSATITEGSSCVFINDRPVARLDDSSSHGGKISSGSNNITIGTGGNTTVEIGSKGEVIFGDYGYIHLGGLTLSSTTLAEASGVAPKHGVSPCTALWVIEEQAAHAISDQPDLVRRNKDISAAYAKLYQANPKLRWSGVAAFASKQVGCGLVKSRKMRDSMQTAIDYYRQQPIKRMEDSAANNTNMILADSADTMYKSLGVGNKAVFDEIYPVMQFYNKYGLAKLLSCAGERNNPIDTYIVKGLAEIDKGNINSGTEFILWHEQKDTLGNAIYKNEDFADLLYMNQLGEKAKIGRLFGSQPMTLSFSAACSGKDELPFTGLHLADFKERWPYAQSVAAKFKELATDPNSYLNDEIAKIAATGGGED